MDQATDNTQGAQPRAKRRWYQFSLWSMLAWVAVIGVLLMIGLRWIAPARQQQAAVEMVERLGGRAYHADPPMNESWLKSSLRDWLPQDYFDPVEGINLSLCPLTDDDASLLRNTTHLQSLRLGGTKITDAGLAHLCNSTQLQMVGFSDTTITDAGLAHLSVLTKLQTLFLNNTQITNDGLPYLSKLTELRRLELINAKITDSGLEHLTCLKQLKWLNLGGTQVSDAGIAQLEEELPECVIYGLYRD